MASMGTVSTGTESTGMTSIDAVLGRTMVVRGRQGEATATRV
jgi:hypothetical protein